MNIFISQTKGKSREVAEALHDWLRYELELGVPWMSTKNIPGRMEWRTEVRNALKEAKLGIFCITTDSLTNQWMLFEAGALFLNETPIFPYVIDLETLTKIPDPIGNLQGKRIDEEGTRDLVTAINNALGEPIDTDTLARKFKSKWEILDKKLEGILKITVDDYEQALKDFMEILININDYRLTLNFSPMVDRTIELFGTRTLKMKELIDTLVEEAYELIQKGRENFSRESMLVGNLRDFFEEHFNQNDLRNVILRMQQVLFDSPPDKLREELLLLVKKEESDVYLSYHQKLVDKLREYQPRRKPRF
jgi:TIR domain